MSDAENVRLPDDRHGPISTFTIDHTCACPTYDHVATECHAKRLGHSIIQTRIDQLCALCQPNSLILDIDCGPASIRLPFANSVTAPSTPNFREA